MSPTSGWNHPAKTKDRYEKKLPWATELESHNHHRYRYIYIILGNLQRPVPAGWSPQMVVNSKGIPPKMALNQVKDL